MSSDPAPSSAASKLQALFRGWKTRRSPSVAEARARIRAEVAKNKADPLRSPYVPSGGGVLAQLLEFASLRGDDRLLDLGSGDGRVVVETARLVPGLRAVGVEKDEGLVAKAAQRLAEAASAQPALVVDELDARQSSVGAAMWDEARPVAQFVQGGIEDEGVRELLGGTTVLFTFLLPRLMHWLARHRLQYLPDGARIVSYTFAYPQEMEPLAVEWVRPSNSTRLYLWVMTPELRALLATLPPFPEEEEAAAAAAAADDDDSNE